MTRGVWSAAASQKPSWQSGVRRGFRVEVSRMVTPWIFVVHAMIALLLKTARYWETNARIPSIRVSRASGYPTSKSNFPVFRSAATQTPHWGGPQCNNDCVTTGILRGDNLHFPDAGSEGTAPGQGLGAFFMTASIEAVRNFQSPWCIVLWITGVAAGRRRGTMSGW